MGRRRGRRRSPFKLELKKDTVYSVAALLFIGTAGVILLSFTRQTALLKMIYTELWKYAGWASAIIPFLCLSAGLMLTKLQWRITRPNVLVGGVLVFFSIAAVTKSGIIGFELWKNIAVLITNMGAAVIYIGLFVAGFIILTETPLDELLLRVSAVGGIAAFPLKILKKDKTKEGWEQGRKIKGLEQSSEIKFNKADHPGHETDKKEDGKKDQLTEAGKTAAAIQPIIPGASQVIWKYPPLNLLSESLGGKADRGDVKKNAQIIEQTLDSFGIQARVSEVNYGPAVTQYALEIALGTKLAKITTLQNDLALALAAPTGQIRIEAPIPGRSMVGIEVPNRSPEFVTLRKMLSVKELKNHPSKLAVGLGLNVAGEPVVADIATMPHVLIAGSTGSGKSVSINSFLCTILFRASPDEVKMILVDPKRVELTGYNGIPHLFTPVIVEPAQVIAALRWALSEMDRRYKVFAEVGVRNIAGYNEQAGFQAMPYILIVIDELADIMLFSPSDVEDAVTRLAQMARATGIHLILSTQRPSTDVITGLIKANIPTRIAFNVASMVDSRVILDTPGAEKLLGRGDMLYIPPTQSKPTRIQGAYVSDAEIRELINNLKQQGVEPQYDQAVTEKYQPGKASPGAITGPGGEAVDALFEQAVQIVTMHDKASASLLQRRLSVGYARAARILDQLEHHGIVGQAEGSKPRDVLIKNAEEALALVKESQNEKV